MSAEDGDAVGPGAVSWYRRWFGEEYLDLYPHRDLDEARNAVELLVEGAGLAAGGRVLDLACGAGRHLEILVEKGLDAFGLDLSLPLLERARARHAAGRVVRGDMRVLPFASDRFEAVGSFFTSFGYFDSEAEDRRVVREVARVLRPGGYLLLDFLNAEAVRRELRPRDERELAGRTVVQERRLVRRGRMVEKRIRIASPIPEEDDREFVERVRLYGARELEEILESEGLEARDLIGDYGGGPWASDSPRVIILARARQ